jgi:ABC-2 type transport system ATP-binding protein
LLRDNQEIFTNTKKSTQIRQLMLGILVVAFLELSVIIVAIFMLMPKGWLLILAVGFILSLYAYASCAMFLILHSAHGLTGDQLDLRLGTWFKCRIPLALVAAVDRVTPASLPKPDLIGVTIARAGECGYCFSQANDLIRITLSQPIMIKAPLAGGGSKRGLVHEVIINADEPDQFIEKLTGVIDKQHHDQARAGDDNFTALISAKTPAEPAIITREFEADRIPGLELEGLTRYYGDYPAVQDLSLQVCTGEIFGFLGANGAGKSTTIKMITGLLQPTAGTVQALGENLWQPGKMAVRRQIGYIPDTPLLYERLTAREHLVMAGHLYGIPPKKLRERAEELLSLVDLQTWSDQMIVTYSMGMQRKVSLALALLADPEVIIVDELTNAFDAPTLAEIKAILIGLRNEGKTVFLSTHVMDVAEKLCDRVAIIHRGRLIALGTVKELCQSLGVDGGLEPLFLKLTGNLKQGSGVSS